MGRRTGTTVLTATAALMLLWHGGDSSAQPVPETGPIAEVTADGLHRVNPSIMAAAWVKPDLDLSLYTRIFFMPTVVQIRKMSEQRLKSRRIETQSEFQVSDLTTARLRDTFGESFYEAVSDVRSYELSDELGRDVLMVQGFLTDVVSGVPPDLAGLNVGSVKWALQANIVLELRDSMSGEVLARTVDQRRMEGPFDPDQMWGLTSRFAQDWSRLLVRRVGELSGLYTSRLRRLQELSGE